jgi:hypothetical protein
MDAILKERERKGWAIFILTYFLCFNLCKENERIIGPVKSIH